MNVIFTYKRTEEISSDNQQVVDRVQFIEIPEMIRTEYYENDVLQSVKIPYQATVQSQEQYDYLVDMLNSYGELEIIGIWDEEGNIIEFNISKYRDALKDVEIYEEKEFINGEDYTGRVEEFEPETLKDEEGQDLMINDNPVFEDFIYEKRQVLVSKRRPTLSEARNIHVNVFNSEFTRKLF